MLPYPKITRKLLTNNAYGFPRGASRRIDPMAIACVHVTANPSTPPASAMQERNYADRAGSGGPSAHFYVDRDGSAVQAIDPKYAAWSNGDIRSPKLAVPGVQAVVNLNAGGLNTNEAYGVEIETCGRYPDYPITKEQESTIAWLVASTALRLDLPIDRSTVHLHSDLNTETRPNCPVPQAQGSTFVSRIIALARDYFEVMDLHAKIDDLSDRLTDALGRAETAEALSESLKRDVAAQKAVLDAWGTYGDEVTSRAGGILGLDRPGATA